MSRRRAPDYIAIPNAECRNGTLRSPPGGSMPPLPSTIHRSQAEEGRRPHERHCAPLRRPPTRKSSPSARCARSSTPSTAPPTPDSSEHARFPLPSAATWPGRPTGMVSPGERCGSVIPAPTPCAPTRHAATTHAGPPFSRWAGLHRNPKSARHCGHSDTARQSYDSGCRRLISGAASADHDPTDGAPQRNSMPGTP